MMTLFGMTPYFTVRVWSPIDRQMDWHDTELGLPRHLEVVAEIEVGPDTNVTIQRHARAQLIPQRMLERKKPPYSLGLREGAWFCIEAQ